MPTVTIARKDVTEDELTKAIQSKLGDRYSVVSRGADVFKVQLGAMSWANVRVVRQPESTQFHVHGGGLLISRALNELGIARKVAEAIKSAGPDLGTPS